MDCLTGHQSEMSIFTACICDLVTFLMHLAIDLLYFANELSFEVLVDIALSEDQYAIMIMLHSFSNCLSFPLRVGKIVSSN